VDYEGFESRKKDLDILFNQYISRIPIKNLQPAQIKAFLINVYNILTIRGLLEFYPIKSILKKVDRTRLGFHYWKDTFARFGDTTLSLDEIEHQYLRKTGDPRIHFAIVCGARSCPKLLQTAYRYKDVENQLQEQAKDFFSSARNVRFEHELQVVYLSELLNWFEQDFGSNSKEILKRVQGYLDEGTAAQLSGQLSEYAIAGYVHYDWSLNEQTSSKKD
jgi:hypothetical protein